MHPTTCKYIDQQKIYNIIGREMLENAWYDRNYSGKAITAVFLLMDKPEQENRIQYSVMESIEALFPWLANKFSRKLKNINERDRSNMKSPCLC